MKRIWLTMMLGAVLCACSTIQGAAADAGTETEPEEGQRSAKIRVLSITGNELTYIEMEDEEESEETAGTEEMSEELTETEARPEEISENVQEETAGQEQSEWRGRGDMGQRTEDGEGTRPDMEQFQDGEMPDREQLQDGEMPDRGQFQNGEMPDMSQPGDMELPGMRGSTIYLPVKVKVYSDTGEEVSYTILEEGDELEVLFEEDDTGEEIITEMRFI